MGQFQLVSAIAFGKQKLQKSKCSAIRVKEVGTK